MYINRRVKSVYNRCKPKIKDQSKLQAILAKGFSVSKKPPKAEHKDNENTHYQRAHVKNVKLVLFSEASDNPKELSVIHRMDVKAYLHPGTGEGFAGVRNQKILTLSDAEKARKLPKYDWPKKLVYQRPGRKHGTLGNLGTLGNHIFRGFRDFLEFCVFEQTYAILENTEMLQMYGNSVIKAIPISVLPYLSHA